MDLSLARKVGYPVLSSKIRNGELESCFSLSKSELKFLDTIKQKKNVLALAVLLKCYSHLHYFPSKLKDVPKHIIEYIALQLNKDANQIESYDKLRSVKQYHVKLIREYLNSALFEDHKNNIEKWLYEFASITDNYVDIFKDCVKKLIVENIELPALNTISKLISNSLDKANMNYFEYIDKSLTKKQKQMINDTVKEIGKQKSELTLLKLIPGKPNINTLNEQEKLLRKLKSFNLNKEVMEMIPVAKRESFAKQGKEYNIRDLRNFNASKRYTIISCFVYKNYQETIDNTTLIFIKIVRKMHSRARDRLETLLLKKISRTSSKMEILHKMTEIVLDNWNETSRNFKKQFINYKAKDEYEKINLEVEKMISSGLDHYGLLNNYFSYSRRFSKPILKTLAFDSDVKNNCILQYVGMIRRKDHEARGVVRNDVIPEKWRKYIFDEKGRYNWRYFELYVLSELANALQSGEIWVKDSKEYSSIYHHIISKKDWQKEYKKYFNELKWDTDKEKFVVKVKSMLSKSCEKFNKGINRNKYVRIKNHKLSITPIKKRELPLSVIALRQRLSRNIGSIDLTDLLVDVQNQLNFCEYFKHVGGKIKTMSKETTERLLAALHSYGCNLGPSQTAKSSKYSEMQIISTKKFYFSEENLRDANNEIVNKFNRISISNKWGDGSSVSADGRLIRMAERNLMASWNVKYKGIGGMLYTHVSDKYIAIFSQFINCGVYEAEYVLDALLNEDNDIDIKPDTIHVDTHGQTEMLFGFCFLLGINLMPRIKNLGDHKLYGPDNGKYKYIDAILKHKIDWELIKNNFFGMMRIIASIRCGKVRSSFILKKLTTYRRANKTFLAFRELGKVVRTMYIFQYASSVDTRRIVQRGCNKAELWHSFQKFVYFGQNGELRANDLEDQRNSTTALELVCNCIAYWNALKIDAVVNDMIKEKDKIKLSDVGYMTPLITQHINRFGRFEFDLCRK